MSSLPLPDISDPEFVAYFQGCRLGELRVHQCSDCLTKRWPPRPTCSQCGSAQYSWIPIGGRGQIYSFIVVHRAEGAAFADRLPYTVVVVEHSDEPSIRFLGNMVECDPAELAIGQPVEAVFQEFAEGVVMPNWRLVR